MWPRSVLAVDAMRFWSAKPPDSDRAAGGGLQGCPLAGRPAAPLAGAAVVLEWLFSDRAGGGLRAASRPASRLVHRPEPTGATSPMRSRRRRSCRPSFAVAFEHRLAHRA